MTRQSFDLWTFCVLSKCATDCANKSTVSARIELATSELTARRNNHYAKKPIHLYMT